MSVLTFDLETGTKTAYKRRASPFNEENYVVAAGFKRDNGEPFGTYFDSQSASEEYFGIPFKDSDTLLVGFNIKFDNLYSWHCEELKEFFRRGGQIWDCQYVEYLLEGHRQHAQMISMDECVEKYGGTLKIDAVKQLWDEGVDTPDIPEDLLMDYLLGNSEEGIEGDVNNTYLIFCGQVERAKKIHPNFLAMVARRMDGLLATTEMEYNGLYVNRDTAERDRSALADELVQLDSALAEFIPELPPELEFNWASVYHKSYLIYGGWAKYQKWVQHTDVNGHGLYAKRTAKWPLFEGVPRDPDCPAVEVDPATGLHVLDGHLSQDVFKSGKRKGEGKTKNVQVDDFSRPKGAKKDHAFRFPGYVSPDPRNASSLTDAKDNPIYSTSSDVVEELVATSDIPFLKTLGERQAAAKLLGTYYWTEDPKTGERKGMLTLVGDDGIVHHKLNHTSTVTTRLSSSDPNGQNIPRGDSKAKSIAMRAPVKRMFESRFGSEGVMAEIDYSQLEVVIQGLLSRDKQLLADLAAGVDFHCKRLSAKRGEPYEEVLAKAKGDNAIKEYVDERQDCKEFSFQRAYGAGVHKIALTTGMAPEEVEALIQAEERLYPGITFFDQTVENSIAATKQVTNREIFVAGQRFNACIGEWFSPTGTRYVWTESETPRFMHKHGKYVGFSPTERKNWPVQGDGGFVVQAMIGYLWRYFLKHDNFGGMAFLVNTVHDCVWIDMHKSVVDIVLPPAKQILEAVPSMYKRSFNMDIPVRFPTEVEVGPNMLELEHYHG